MKRAIITLTDEADGIHVRLEFDPPAKADERISGAQWLAGEMLKIASNILERADDEGGAE